MSDEHETFKRQMLRQSTWLKDSWLWLLKRYVLSNRKTPNHPLTALDVGCGPGYVMDIIGQEMQVKGVDIDPQVVRECASRGLDVSIASGEHLPYDDESFDCVYCTFLLLWLRKPAQVVSEMRRVSRNWVGCLAEPDFGGRLSFPDSVKALDRLVVDGIKNEGGDPFVGRKLKAIFAECDMAPQMGIHPGVWDIGRLRQETENEWRWIEMTVNPSTKADELQTIRRSWDKALDDGTLFQFNPIFYALAKK